MSIDYKDIGQRIKRLRMEKGLTQERLSEVKIGRASCRERVLCPV